MAFELGMLAGIVSGFATFAWLIFMLVVLAGVAAVLWFSGILRMRPHKVEIFEPRSGGEDIYSWVGYGRYIAGGKYEIFKGPFNVLNVVAPKSTAIRYGTKVWGYSENGKDVHWFESSESIRIDASGIRLEPSLNPGMIQAANNQLRTNISRFKDVDKWKQYLPIITLFVCGIMLAGALYGSAALLMDGYNKGVAATVNRCGEMWHQALQNATIEYNYAYPGVTGTTQSGTGSPPPGMPAG